MSANLENSAVVTVFIPIPTKGNAKECLNSYMCCAESLSRVRLFTTPGMQPARLLCPWGFSRQEYWSGLPCPPPGDLPNPEIEPRSATLQADSLPSEPPGKPRLTEIFLMIGSSPSYKSGHSILRLSNSQFLNCFELVFHQFFICLKLQKPKFILIHPSFIYSY